jgi:hypothetical protein
MKSFTEFEIMSALTLNGILTFIIGQLSFQDIKRPRGSDAGDLSAINV